MEQEIGEDYLHCTTRLLIGWLSHSLTQNMQLHTKTIPFYDCTLDLWTTQQTLFGSKVKKYVVKKTELEKVWGPHTHTHTHNKTYRQTYAIHTDRHTPYIHTDIHHTYTQTYTIHTDRHTPYIHTDIHHTYTQTYTIHTHRHTPYIHTDIHINIPASTSCSLGCNIPVQSVPPLPCWASWCTECHLQHCPCAQIC